MRGATIFCSLAKGSCYGLQDLTGITVLDKGSYSNIFLLPSLVQLYPGRETSRSIFIQLCRPL